MTIVFYELFVRLRLMSDIQHLLRVTPEAVQIIRSDTLTDLEKEISTRKMSVSVLMSTLRFTSKLVLSLLLCIAIAAAAQYAFKVSDSGLYDLLASWQALAAMLITGVVYSRLRRG